MTLWRQTQSRSVKSVRERRGPRERRSRSEGARFDSGPPLVGDEPAATYEHTSDEHGRLSVSATSRLGIGDKIRLIPGHCHPTVNLWDWYVCVTRQPR